LEFNLPRKWACSTPNYGNLWQIHTTNGSVEEVFRNSLNLITLNFNECTDQELYLQVKCFVTNATNYDVFIGKEALFPPSFTIDNWFEHVYYQMDWEIDGHHLGYIPLDLHGNHNLMAHHCMFKKTHIISYIQQASHKWIKEDEKVKGGSYGYSTWTKGFTEVQNNP